MNCRYPKCFHESKEIPTGTEVKVGSAYYHADCFKVKEDIGTIRSLFAEKINPDVVFSQLNSVLNKLVFEMGINPEFILFGVQYYIDHKIILRYPAGLFYVVQNKDVKSAFDDIKAKSIKAQINNTIPTVDNGQSFEYKKSKVKGITDILC